MKKLSETQLLLKVHLAEILPGEEIVTEHRFCPERQFRFDVAVPRIKLGLECDGGAWTGGHRRNQDIELDHEKTNLAQMLGWFCLRFTNAQVADGRAREFIQRFLAYRALNRLKESLSA